MVRNDFFCFGKNIGDANSATNKINKVSKNATSMFMTDSSVDAPALF